jgi:hypothetical protein
MRMGRTASCDSTTIPQVCERMIHPPRKVAYPWISLGAARAMRFRSHYFA